MRQNNFDFLRFFFAFIVVIGHLIVITGNTTLHALKPYFNTYTSVTAFFCISGFLIAQSYCNTKSIKRYFLKRAARLLPAYVVVILASAIGLSIISQLSVTDYFSGTALYKYLIANLSFLNFIQPDLPGVFIKDGLTTDVNGALWTLKIELSFYLAIPVLFYLLNKTRNKTALLIAIYILSVMYKNGLDMLGNHNQTFTFLARQLPGFLSYFCSGIFIYLRLDTFLRYKNKLILAAFLIFFAESCINAEIFSPAAMAIIVFFFAFSLKQLNNFGKYGDISYGIYIVHCPIIKTITYFGFFDQYNPFLISFITICLVVLIAFISWHTIEKRFLSLVHRSH